ncbi:MAG: sigma-70 family RNA polymerase sigma factor [Candidatus Cloacimonadota bacterium]|nr:sigma-70 family RNA polymerase sigma factor [Candidatus Cloacimonadota bacterium]
MRDQKIYQRVKNLAYRTICKYVSNQEDREDLAQTVLIKYYLHEEKLQKDNLSNWVITVAKNASIDHNKSKNFQISKKTLNYDDLENIITERFLSADKKTKEKEIKSLDDILESHSKIISQPERILLERYIKSGFKIKKLAYRRRNTSSAAIKKKIYRLKADIRAEYNKGQGIIASRLIVGAKLHENLRNFLRKFKKSLETNSLDKMKFYFKDCEIPPKIPNIKIKKILDYDIKLIGEKKYKLYIHYINKEDAYSSIMTIFEIYNENSIKIIQFPTLSKKILRVDLDKIIGNIIMQTKEDGTLKMSKREILEYLKGKAKIKELHNKKNHKKH